LAFLFWLAWVTGNPLLQANPAGGAVGQGSASFNTSGSTFTINQSSANAYINWNSFNIGAGETTTFNQPSATSVTWNHINDPNLSTIAGTINANGYIILQNQNGFDVTGSAVINTHGLVMTTSPTPAPNLDNGGPWTFSAPAPTAKIINLGQINLTAGGSGYLIASDIENNGTISAPGGTIGLYAGQKVLLSMTPDGHGLSAEITLPQGSVDNEGKLIADAGTILAQAKTVNQNGLVQANSIQNINGVIELVASDSVNLGANSTISAQQINLQASDDITLSTVWTLTDPGASALLTLIAGNSIILNAGSGINAGNNWTVNLTAGPKNLTAAPASGTDGIYLNGSAYIQTRNGDINVWAANEVLIDTSSQAGNNGIRTLNGGSINVTAQFGDVNTGANIQGYSYVRTAPYYSVSPTLGGISTAAGGDVTITAGGDVTSYLPSGNADAGTGAFGSEPGNVTISAGGNVYGHYVLGNGIGIITAGEDVGGSSGADAFALSLMTGSWSVNAPNGNIYLQEVRNPNGVFNSVAGLGINNPAGEHLFNYGAEDSVDLNAGVGVYLTDLNLPRPNADVPVLYPPILDISAGSGGVTLEGNVTLFPSADQNLTITTTEGGSLTSRNNGSGTIPELLMSDSAQSRWTSLDSFSDQDHGPLSAEPNELNPVVLDISGNMENLTLITTKETHITVGGDMIGCGFSGQNLSASDTTFIKVGGEIYNQSGYAFIYGVAPSSVPVSDLPAAVGSSWDNIFLLALNPDEIPTPSSSVLTGVPPAQLATDIIQAAGLFSPTYKNGLWVFTDQGFTYNPATGRLGYGGPMAQNLLSDLTQTITVLHLVDGQPVIDPKSGLFETDTVNWIPSSQIQALFTASQVDPSPQSGQLGYRIGGPGDFDLAAGSISLGNTFGILSVGASDPQGGFSRYNNLASITPLGATLNVTVSGDLNMLTSTIATLGGGDVNVTSTGGSMDLGSEEVFNQTRQVGFGVYTAGPGNVDVTALGNVNIDGSRIAAYDGGNIAVESLAGNVDVGTGGATQSGVYYSYVNPITGQGDYYPEFTYGSGIVAYTLVPGTVLLPGPPESVGIATVPGNITVETPRGDITASLGGILQEALDGNVSTGPTINLVAGTFPSGNSQGYTGNIDVGQSGVIGSSVNATANGNISGLFISSGNSDITAAQNFSGTVFATGTASVSGGGTVSGTIVGVTGASVSGASIGADVLSQNASVNGGAGQATLGSSATASSTAQSAANATSNENNQQTSTTTTTDDDEKNKKKLPILQRMKRVTVLLGLAATAR
jgi:filamentous hemagglutinin family protein